MDDVKFLQLVELALAMSEEKMKESTFYKKLIVAINEVFVKCSEDTRLKILSICLKGLTTETTNEIKEVLVASGEYNKDYAHSLSSIHTNIQDLIDVNVLLDAANEFMDSMESTDEKI